MKASQAIELVFMGLWVFAAAAAGIAMTQTGGGLASIWIANGVAIGMLVTCREEHLKPGLAVSGLAILLANLLMRDSPPLALGLTLTSLLEICTASYFLNTNQRLRELGIDDRRFLLRILLIASVIAPALSSIPAAALQVHFEGVAEVPALLGNFFASALGNIIVVPFLVAYLTGQMRGTFGAANGKESALILLLVAATSLVVFNSQNGLLLFLIFPVITIAAFRGGLALTALSILVVAAIGLPPTMLLQSQAGPDYLSPILLLQLLLAVLVISKFAVSVLLHERFQLTQTLKEAKQELLVLASTDALTGIRNRRMFDVTFETEWKRAARNVSPLSLAFIDVDHFKAYNDLLGHLEGDAALRRVAEVISRGLLRPADFVARYGGEEFVVILPDTPLEGAISVAEKIREAMELEVLPHPHAEDANVTISIGVATLVPSPRENPQTLLLAADRALYRAKNEGRNRVCHDGKLAPAKPFDVLEYLQKTA